MKGQQIVGTVIDAKDDFFVAAFGAIKTAVKAQQLEKVQHTEQKSKDSDARLLPLAPRSSSAPFLSEKKMNFKLEIDVRGMRGDEALQAVMYYIDDAVQCNAGRVRLLHGTGTGALRQIIREYLKTAPGVKHFQDEHVQFGGSGITVVELE
jgi:DNA mismatch repair protein MutS2